MAAEGAWRVHTGYEAVGFRVSGYRGILGAVVFVICAVLISAITAVVLAHSLVADFDSFGFRSHFRLLHFFARNCLSVCCIYLFVPGGAAAAVAALELRRHRGLNSCQLFLRVPNIAELTYPKLSSVCKVPTLGTSGKR